MTTTRQVMPAPYRLRQLRESVGMSQGQAAKFAGLSESTYRRAERGDLVHRDPALSVALRLVDFATWCQATSTARKVAV